MIDLKTKFGRVSAKHLKSEYFVWLTTVDSTGTPQPRPVWFIWDKDSFLIFSQSKAYKIQHIKQNNSVSLHFNCDDKAHTNVIIYIGKAVLDGSSPPSHKVPAYLRKYGKAIKEMGMTPEEFSGEFSVAIRIKPTSLRG